MVQAEQEPGKVLEVSQLLDSRDVHMILEVPIELVEPMEFLELKESVVMEVIVSLEELVGSLA